MISLARRLWGKAWLVLTFATVLFGANGVAARMITGEMSVASVVFLRWCLVCLILIVSLRGRLAKEAVPLRHYWRSLLLMGFFAFTAFNTLFYLAAYSTSAINITLLQSSTPPMVLAGAALFHRIRITSVQIGGMALTFLGVGLIAAQGDPARLSALSFNSGDCAILLACFFYSGYTLALRNRPKVPAVVFFAGIAFAALLTALPLFVIEIAHGSAYWPSAKGWLLVLFIALGPSLTAQLAYMRGVELIGPGRAGLFNNLVPLFGALFAVMILGEVFAFYHAMALVLGIGGIYLAERQGGRLF